MSLNELTGIQLRIVREAVLDAFNRADLNMMLSDKLDKQLDMLVGNATLPNTVFKLLQRTQQEGWTDKFIEAIQTTRPNNPKVRTLIGQLRMLRIKDDDRDRLVESSLEKTVKKRAGINDFVPWALKLLQMRGMICRIEDPRDSRKALGTGFLVGRDLLLTNYHVVENYIDVPDDTGVVRDTKELQCRFDYAIESTGEHPGLIKSPAAGTKWLVDHSRYSAVDPGDQGGFPKETEMDFALIRLSEPVGDGPGPDGVTKRGWIPISTMVSLPEPTDVVFIVQHPNGDPLKLAVGAVIKRNDNGTRLRYDANTEGGSSGSPCLDAKLNLVAVHHGGDPAAGPFGKFNQGIPIDRIVARLAVQPGLAKFWT